MPDPIVCPAAEVEGMVSGRTAPRKRWRRVTAKTGQLVAKYGREDRHSAPDILYAWGGGGAEKPDARILMRAIEDIKIFDDHTLVEELNLRGYDITTLRFSIEMKEPANIDTPEAQPIGRMASEESEP